MRQRHLALYVIVAFFLISIAIGIVQTSAQQSASISSQPVNATTELEGRIFKLEVVQAQNIEALRSSNDSYKSSMTWFSILITILIVIQGGIFYGQWRREGERNSRQDQTENARLRAELKGVDDVSKVMALVEQTLASRLATEKDARDKLDEIRGQIGSLKSFYENFQGAIENSRNSIEKAGTLLAQTPRQEFRSKTEELNSFSKQYDEFIRDFAPIEDKKRRFSPQVPYIRGIAAHYSNHPESAKQYLSDVIGFHKPEEGESEIDYNRRVANAYYYLGLIESNFSNYRDAIDYFNKAKPESQRDFLTMVVTAEAYLMNNEFEMAMQLISRVKEGLQDIKHISDLRLRSRAVLMEASIPIMKQEGDWLNEAQQLLEPVHEDDPLYYYATATLGQIYKSQKDSRAQKLFQKAYTDIEHSNDLITMTEVRVRIHLLMVAGMCCRNGLLDLKRSEEHLDRADALLNSLPKIGSNACSVFSNLSKRNEKSAVIHSHIELIREDKVLL